MTTHSDESLQKDELGKKIDEWWDDWNVEEMPSRPKEKLEALITEQVRLELEQIKGQPGDIFEYKGMHVADWGNGIRFVFDRIDARLAQLKETGAKDERA